MEEKRMFIAGTVTLYRPQRRAGVIASLAAGIANGKAHDQSAL
jgi:hypothetical protein